MPVPIILRCEHLTAFGAPVVPEVKIRMISQGASEINLTFVIEEDAVPDVVKRLHSAFFAEVDAEGG